MVTFKTQRVLIYTLSSLLGLSACIDNKYDLNNLNTDNIEIGENITAPLGRGTIEADKLLNIKNVKEIKIDADGNYRVVYTDTLEITMPDEMDLQASAIAFSESFSLAPTRLTETLELPGLSEWVAIDFTNLPKKIKTIDSVRFDRSNLDLRISLTDYKINTGAANLTFDMDFPEGFILESSSSSLYTLSDNKRSIQANIPFSQLKQNYVQLPIKIKKAVPGNIGVDNFGITLSGSSATFIKGRNPVLDISVGFDNLDYKVVYGKFNIDFDNISSHINMGDFNGIFEGDNNVLSFADPHIKLVTESNVGIALDCDFFIKGITGNNQSQETTVSDITVSSATGTTPVVFSKWWIGGIDSRSQYPGNGQEYTFREAKGFAQILKMMPQQLDFNFSVISKEEGIQFFTRNAYAKVNYEVEIPFAPAKDFMANITENITDAFDEDLIDYLFANGSATIGGSINNSFPLNFVMNLIIVDATGQPTGINFTPQSVKGSNDGKAIGSEVAFTIAKQDIDKMKNAKDIIVSLTVKCDDQLAGKCIKKGQQLELNLRLLKSGGITIEN